MVLENKEVVWLACDWRFCQVEQKKKDYKFKWNKMWRFNESESTYSSRFAKTIWSLELNIVTGWHYQLIVLDLQRQGLAFCGHDESNL